MLPPFKSIFNTKIIKSDINNFNNTLSISFFIPVIPRKFYKITEIIPIPFLINNETMILNENQKTLIEINETLLSADAFGFPCDHYGMLMICNAIFDEKLEPINNCTKALISNQHIRSCMLKQIENKNYIFQLTEKLFYFFIKNPIKIKIECTNSTEIINIEKSTTKTINKNCIINKKDEDIPRVVTSIFETHMELEHPELKTFNFSTQKWNENSIIIPKYEIKNIEMKRTFDDIKSSIYISKENLKKIKYNANIIEFLGIDQYLNKIIIVTGLIILAIILSCLCLKSIIKKST